MIYLIAGHHDNDPGAVSGGYKEADLTKELRNLIADRIRQKDPEIKLWLDDDRDTLSQVIAKIRKRITNKDILLDIHFDAAANTKATGTTAIVSRNAGAKSKAMAKDLSAITSTVLGIPNRGAHDESYTARGRIGILNTRGSSVLLEVAFITNPDDMKAYFKNDEAIKHWLAEEISCVLIDYIY